MIIITVSYQIKIRMAHQPQVTSSQYNPTFIARNTILRGETFGTHVLDEPIDGYKKVECVVEYKKIFTEKNEPTIRTEQVFENCIAKLKIPKGATIIRSYSDDNYNNVIVTSNKLRANTYEILDIEPTYYHSNVIEKKVIEASSLYKSSYKYEKGKTYVEDLDPNEKKQCTTGLHFFLNRNEAQLYVG
jgi:hypothetical protein